AGLWPCLYALEGHGHRPAAVVLLGSQDDYAVEQVCAHFHSVMVKSITPPDEWTPEGISRCAEEQNGTLRDIRNALQTIPKVAKNIVARDREAVWHPYT